MLFPPRDFFSSQIRPVDELIFRKILEAIEREETKGDSSRKGSDTDLAPRRDTFFVFFALDSLFLSFVVTLLPRSCPVATRAPTI